MVFGATIRVFREIQCLPYAGFFLVIILKFTHNSRIQHKRDREEEDERMRTSLVFQWRVIMGEYELLVNINYG